MARTYLLRLPDAVGEEIEKIAKIRGQGYATVIKGIVCEHMNTNAPAVNPAKTSASAARTTA